MTQHHVAPQRTRRPASKLVAGLLWLVAAGTAVTATFSNIVFHVADDGESIVVVGFWRQYRLTLAGEDSPGSIYYGAAEVSAAALLLLAVLLTFLSTRRWAAVAAGGFGTGMLVTSTLTWSLTALSTQAGSTTAIQPGLWTLAVATAVALAAFLVSLAGLGQPGFAPSRELPDAQTPPSGLPTASQALQQAQWEAETPKYGIPVQQQPSAPRRAEPESEPAVAVPAMAVAAEPAEHSGATERGGPAEPARPAVSHEEDVFMEAFDLPEFTGNGSRPGRSGHRFDGDET